MYCRATMLPRCIRQQTLAVLARKSVQLRLMTNRWQEILQCPDFGRSTTTAKEYDLVPAGLGADPCERPRTVVGPSHLPGERYPEGTGEQRFAVRRPS